MKCLYDHSAGDYCPIHGKLDRDRELRAAAWWDKDPEGYLRLHRRLDALFARWKREDRGE